MKSIKYLLSLGLLLCAAVSAQQQFDAGSSNTLVDASRSDKTRLIKDRTDYRYTRPAYQKYPARQAIAAQPAGMLTGDRTVRGMSSFIPSKYKTNANYSIFGYAGRDINKPATRSLVYNADRFSAGVQFDFRNMLKKAHWL